MRPRRFRTSIVAVVCAIFLNGAAVGLVNAAQEPLRPAVIRAINFLIVKGRFDALAISDLPPMWNVAVESLGIGAISLGLALVIAYWNHRRPAA
ncbi:MAG TPA: hypothetical protein VF532_18560 [Candidatus Angelobacter sp.]